MAAKRQATSRATASKRTSTKRPASARPTSSAFDDPIPTPEERRTAARAIRKQVGRSAHGSWEPGDDRPDPIELLVEQNRARVPELVPLRFGRMAVVALRIPPGLGARDGPRPRHHPRRRHRGPALRRRTPRQLRHVREPRAAADVRPQRLRRGLARPVRVGRQAPGREPRRRGPGQRVRSHHRPTLGARGRRPVPRLDGALLGDDPPRRLVRRGSTCASSSTPAPSAVRRQMQPLLAKAEGKNHLKALAKLTVEVDGRRRIVDDPPVVEHIADERVLDPAARSRVRRVPPDPQRRPAGPVRPLPLRRLRPQGRRRRQRRHPRVDGAVPGTQRRTAVPAAEGGEPVGDRARPRRRSRRPTTASASSTGSGCSRRRATSCSDGRPTSRPDTTTTCARCGTRRARSTSRPCGPQRSAPTPASAAGRSPAHTPAPATRSPSTATSATPSGSASRSPTSPRPTPTRPNATTHCSIAAIERGAVQAVAPTA